MSDAPLPPLPVIPPGPYRHFKGGRYVVLGVVRCSETLKGLVHYANEKGEAWVRPAEMWDEEVSPGVRRFAPIPPEEAPPGTVARETSIRASFNVPTACTLDERAALLRTAGGGLGVSLGAALAAQADVLQGEVTATVKLVARARVDGGGGVIVPPSHLMPRRSG